MSKIQVFKLTCDHAECTSDSFVSESLTAPVAEAKATGWRDITFGTGEYLFCPKCAMENKLIFDQLLDAQEKFHQLIRPLVSEEKK